MGSAELLILIGLTSGLFAVTSLRRRAVSWSVVTLLFVAAASAGYLLAPERAGWWLIAPFVVLLIAPALGTLLTSRALAARRYRRAEMIARVATLLHPFGAQRSLYSMARGWRLAADGKLDEAEATLLGVSGLNQDDARLEILRLRQRWPEVRTLLERKRNAADLETSLGVLYIRALGETGDQARLIEFARRLETVWQKRVELDEDLGTIRMFVAAFLGRPDLVDAVAARSLSHYDRTIARFWHATGLACAGKTDEATAIFRELTTDADWRMRTAAEYRIAHPPAVAGPETVPATAALEAAIRDAATYSSRAEHGAPRTILPYAFAALLVAVQLAVIASDEGELTTLYEYGLFWSTAVLEDGQWWRIVTAVFLHAGWLHLALNVFALLWFGPFVERFLGRGRFALVALLGGSGGFALLALLDAIGLREPNAALGASGAVMALVGASAGIFLRGSLQRSATAAARLRDMLVFVAIQCGFDVMAVNVSMTGHLTGLVIGFAIGLATSKRPP